MSTKLKLLFVLGFIAAAAALALLKPGREDMTGRYTPSTYSSGPAGCKALYLLLDELRLPVKRFRQSFLRLPGHHGVLVITGPGMASFRRREMVRLEQWIKDGNRLVLCDGFPRSPSLYGWDKSDKKESRRGSETRRSASPSAYFHLSLNKFPPGSRGTLTVPLPGMEGSACLSVSEESRWETAPREWETLAGDQAGPLVITRALGKGTVTALADPSLISNSELGREQNLRLILALLLASGRPEEILFDEYHQGHAAERTLFSYFVSSGFVGFLIQASVGLALFFFSQRAQLSGRFRALASPVGRSSLEYVDSMARVYESCKAAPLALDAIRARFLGEIAHRAGIPIKKLRESKPAQVAAWVGDEKGNLAEVLEECRRVIKGARGTDETLSAARKLALAARRIGLRGKRT